MKTAKGSAAIEDPAGLPGEAGRNPARRDRGPSRVLFFPPRPAAAVAQADEISLAPEPTSSDLVGAGVARTLRRLVQLFWAVLRYAVAGAFDWLTFGLRRIFRRGPLLDRRLQLSARRAARLRRILQRLGGTFIKVGQQLSIRTDVLPPVFCRELEKLQDNAEPIPEAYVRGVLERQTGKPLAATFVAPFDFESVGKASIACVYRARLLTGEAVAIKVRRPNIERVFKSDLAALAWVLRTAEFFTLLRPGVSATFRSEIETMLLEELDFQTEMRYQELFRRYFKKRKKLRTTAPRLFYSLCGPDVIVSELVTGIWMRDLMAGVESGDPQYRAALHALDIDPKRIAKQLVRGSHYGLFECPFFYGDPHPGNIAVQPGNRIVLVDFGACGVFAERERDQLAQMHYYQSREDVGGMVQCVINLMEPLPPVDVESLRRGLEDAWWRGFYGIKSRHAEWRERTSFNLWAALFREVRRHRIPLPLNVLRMIRATLLYDSVAARIYPEIDVFKEYRKYYESYARRVQQRIQTSLLRQLLCGPDPANYVRLKRLWDVGEILLRRVQIFLHKPLPDFSALVSKGWELAIMTLKWLTLSATATAAAMAAGIWLKGAALFKRRAGVGLEAAAPPADVIWNYPGQLLEVLYQDMETKGLSTVEHVFIVWLAVLFFLTAKYLRQAWFRLCDKDVK